MIPAEMFWLIKKHLIPNPSFSSLSAPKVRHQRIRRGLIERACVWGDPFLNNNKLSIISKFEPMSLWQAKITLISDNLTPIRYN